MRENIAQVVFLLVFSLLCISFNTIWLHQLSSCFNNNQNINNGDVDINLAPLANLPSKESANKNHVLNDSNRRKTTSSSSQTSIKVVEENAVEFFRTFLLNPPAPAKVPYSSDINEKKENTYYSQVQQDRKVDDILNQKENGFFVECGAYDGVSLSNSLFFERSRNWTGLLVEANPRAYRELLQKDRKAWSTPACLSTSGNVELGVDFLAHGMLGGYGSDRFQEGGNLAKNLETDPYVYHVKANCFPLNVMLDAIGVDRVDMFSLDVEGVELDVLKTIDFDRFTFSVLVIESNSKETLIGDFLTEKGYSPAPGVHSSSDVFYIHNSMLDKT